MCAVCERISARSFAKALEQFRRIYAQAAWRSWFKIFWLIYFCAPLAGTYAATRALARESMWRTLNHNLWDCEGISMRTAEVDSSLLIAVESNREFIDPQRTTSHSVGNSFLFVWKMWFSPTHARARHPNARRLANRSAHEFSSILWITSIQMMIKFGAATE